MLAGWALLWRFGRAFVFEGPAAIEGYGWAGYVANAWMVTNGVDVCYDRFRLPLHGWMLGSAGEALGSYADGGVVVASLSMGLVVVAAAVTGRALSGPWAGGLAAALLPLVPHNADAARWANSYPTQAALGGAALALAVACARWPRASLALAGGIAGGLAWGVDGRAGLMAVAALALLPLALLERPRATTLAMPLLFALGLSLGPWSAAYLHVGDEPLPTLVEKVEFQRGVALRWTAQRHDDALEAACQDEPSGELPSLAALQRPCAAEMLRHNVEQVLPWHVPLGGALTLGLAGLVLLPGRQGWRGTARAAAFLVACGLPLLAELLWVPLPDRYVVPRAVVLAVLAPAGLGRLAGTLGRAGGWLMGPAAIGLLVYAWIEDPTERWRDTALQESRAAAARSQATADALAALSAEPAPLLDCSDHFVATALLPRLTAPWPPQLRVFDGAACVAWLDLAPAGALISVDPNRPVPLHRSRPGAGQVRFEPSLMTARGWAVVARRPTVELWRKAPPP